MIAKKWKKGHLSISTRSTPTLPSPKIPKMGLILAEDPDQELVFGLAGQFWRIAGSQRLVISDPQDFLAFQQPGYAKVATNFFLSPAEGAGRTRLSTETRIQTFGESARRKFRLYWQLIYPGSALIRKEWLRAIQRRAE